MTCADGTLTPCHQHSGKGELLWSPCGALSIGTPKGAWVVSSQRAVWIPPNTPHEVLHCNQARLHWVLLDAVTCRRLCPHSRTLQVNEELRALVEAVAHRGTTLDVTVGTGRKLISEIEDATDIGCDLGPLPIPLATSERLCPLLEFYRTSPGRLESLCYWENYFGLSQRTLSRWFAEDTGLTFSRWRQLVRLRRALEMIASGSKIANAAQEVGYESVSMFISTFRRVVGTTPGRYF